MCIICTHQCKGNENAIQDGNLYKLKQNVIYIYETVKYNAMKLYVIGSRHE